MDVSDLTAQAAYHNITLEQYLELLCRLIPTIAKMDHRGYIADGHPTPMLKGYILGTEILDFTKKPRPPPKALPTTPQEALYLQLLARRDVHQSILEQYSLEQHGVAYYIANGFRAKRSGTQLGRLVSGVTGLNDIMIKVSPPAVNPHEILSTLCRPNTLFHTGNDIARAFSCVPLTKSLSRWLVQRIAGSLYVGVRGQLGMAALPSIFFAATTPTLNNLKTSNKHIQHFVQEAIGAMDKDCHIPAIGAKHLLAKFTG